MKIIRYAVAIGLGLALGGCATPIVMDPAQFSVELRSAETYGDFIPIDPLPFETIDYVRADGTKIQAAPWVTIPVATIRALLPNQEAVMTTYRVTTSGELKYLTASTTGEAGTYRVVMDYVQYRVEPIKSAQGETLGTGRVGIGLRIKAQIETRKAGIDLGSLIALGIAAKQGQIQGKLSVSSLGIYSPDITTLFPTPSDINETSIQKALEALAAIKSKIGDGNTSLTPQVVAVKPIPLKPLVAEIKNRQV